MRRERHCPRPLVSLRAAGRHRIRGDANAPGYHYCRGRGRHFYDIRWNCAVASRDGGHPGAAHRGRAAAGPVRWVHVPGAGQLAGLPAGPRSHPVRALRPARGLPRPPRRRPAVPGAPGRPDHDDQRAGCPGRSRPGPGVRRAQDRKPAAQRRPGAGRQRQCGDCGRAARLQPDHHWHACREPAPGALDHPQRAPGLPGAPRPSPSLSPRHSPSRAPGRPASRAAEAGPGHDRRHRGAGRQPPPGPAAPAPGQARA